MPIVDSKMHGESIFTREKIKRNLYCFLWRIIERCPQCVRELWQMRQLRHIVRSAYTTIPFYRDLWDSAQCSSSGSKGAISLERLPIVNKRILREAGHAKTIFEKFRAPYHWNQTSGTTGEPFRFPVSGFYTPGFKDRRFSAYLQYRFLRWAGMPLFHIQRSLRIAHIGMRPYPKDDSNYLFIPVSDLRERPKEMLKKILTFHPTLIESVPTILVECARVLLETGLKFSGILLTTCGETLFLSQRSFIERSFESEVFDRYGLEEVGFIAAECKEHKGLHIYEESFLVEILGEDGCPAPEGTPGRVVVTSFYSKIMPFIRYETGDIGSFISNRCPCGLASRRISINGRRGGFISLNSRIFTHIELAMALDDLSQKILRFQIIKTGPDSLSMKIIPAWDFSPGDESVIRKHFHKKTGISPAIEVVRDIPYTVRGKSRVVIDEVLAH